MSLSGIFILTICWIVYMAISYLVAWCLPKFCGNDPKRSDAEEENAEA